MELKIQIQKWHFYILFTLLVSFVGLVLVSAYGSNNPAVFGHSPGELVVNGSSIVDGTVTGSDIDESTLSGTATALTVGGVSCTDCLDNTQINASSLSLSCSVVTTSSASGTDGLSAQATISSNYTVTGGGCSDNDNSGVRFIYRSYTFGNSWVCFSNDGSASVSATLTAYVVGCIIE